jgi:hypothetical protein
LLAALEPTEHAYLLRLPAVLAGTACVALAGMLGGASRPTRFALLVLTATSYLLVHYSSEARGYALAALASVACLVLLWHPRWQKGFLTAVLFNAACLFGLISHFSFLHFYAACLAWWLWRAMRRRPWAAVARESLAFHALPAAAAVGIGLLALSMQVAGGTSRPVEEVLRAGASLTLGLPEHGSLAWLGAGAFAAAIVLVLSRLAARGDDRWILYALGIGLPSAILLIARRGEFAAVRYLLPSVLLSLLLLGEGLGQLHGRGKRGRLAYAVLLLLFVASNARLLAPLLRYGRGEYSRTLAAIADRESKATIEVGLGDESMRLALEHYAAEQERPFRFVGPEGGTTWIIDRERADGRALPSRNPSYEIVERFRGAPRRGGRWILYHRVPSTPD